MNRMKEKIVNIKKKILKQTENLINSVDEAFEAGQAAHELEKELFDQLLRIGFEAMVLFFSRYGHCDMGEQLELEDGRLLNRLDKLRKKDYLSIFGLLEIWRHAYGTREGQKIEYIPLDARVELPTQKFSYLLQDWDQSLSSEMTFSKVNETLAKILNLSVPISSLERTNQNMNKQSEKYWDNQIKIEPAKEKQIVVGSTDNKGVVIRKSVEEKQQYLLEIEHQTKPASIESSSSKKKSGKKKMAVLGATYNIEPNYRTPEQVLESLFRPAGTPSAYENEPPKPKPQNKHIRASMHRDEEDTLQPAREQIFNWLDEEYEKRNPKGAHTNILLMDGEEKQWEMSTELNTPVIEILDIIHASSYVWKAVQALHPDNNIVQNIPIVKKQVGRLLNGETDKVIRSFRWQATNVQLSGKALEKLNTTCGYFEKNIQRMHYNSYLEQGYPIASGVIEGACRHIVVDRMECSGMRWVMEGAKSMLNIRCINVNGDWEHFMKFYIKEEQNGLYPTRAANEESFIESMIA